MGETRDTRRLVKRGIRRWRISIKTARGASHVGRGTPSAGIPHLGHYPKIKMRCRIFGVLDNHNGKRVKLLFGAQRKGWDFSQPFFFCFAFDLSISFNPLCFVISIGWHNAALLCIVSTAVDWFRFQLFQPTVSLFRPPLRRFQPTVLTTLCVGSQ